MALKGFSKGFGNVTINGGVDSIARQTAADNRALIDANKALLAKMMRKPGDLILSGEEVFVESPKVTNWANYTAGDITVPAAPTAAKMRNLGLTLLAAQSLTSPTNTKRWPKTDGTLNFDTVFATNNVTSIWWNEDIDIAGAPLGLATSGGGIIYHYGSNGADDFQYLTLSRARIGMVGDWYRLISAGVPGEWSRQLVGSWQFTAADTQVQSGGNWIVGNGHKISLIGTANGQAIGLAPATDWASVGEIRAPETGWTISGTLPTSGKQAVFLITRLAEKQFFLIGGSGAQASEVAPQTQSQQPAAPVPSVVPVWQITNADLNALITYNAANDITGVQFNYSDPEDETKAAVFSLADMVTGFSPSGYYGGEARFIDATMPSGKVVKIILNKKSAKSLAIIVAKPGANLSVFGKIANVQITAPAPAFKEASYKVYSNADARQTVAAGAEIELNTVAMRENERGFVDADVLASNRIICPHAGVVSVMSMVYANTAAARVSLVHYDAAGTVKRTFVMVAALASGESKESATFNRVKVAAGDRFGLINAASTSAQFFRGESHCELHVTYLPA